MGVVVWVGVRGRGGMVWRDGGVGGGGGGGGVGGEVGDERKVEGVFFREMRGWGEG